MERKEQRQEKEARRLKMNEALKQIGAKGLIIKKIRSAINEIEQYSSGVNIVTPILGNEKAMSEKLKSLRQELNDHVLNYEYIKERVEATNLASTLTFNGVTKSVTAWRAWMQMLHPEIKRGLEAHNLSQGEKTRVSHQGVKIEGAKAPSVVPYYNVDEIAAERNKLMSLYETVRSGIETFNAVTDLM